MTIRIDRDRACYLALATFVALTFLVGGSSRDDVASLPIVRALAMLALAFGLVMLPPGTVKANRGLLALAIATPLLAIIQLVPLPPGLWQMLPGRELAAAVGSATGLADIWRPISLVPHRTVNSLLAFATPLAAILLMLCLARPWQERMLFVVAAIAAVSAVMGLLQTIGGTGNPLYLYRITNPEAAVGLFANRNHNAMMLACLLPLIGAGLSTIKITAEQLRTSEWVAAGFAILVFPFILATQSRAGLVLAPIGLVLGWWTYQRPQGLTSRREVPKFDPRVVFGAVAAGALMVLTLLLSKTPILKRLAEGDPTDELRFQVWGPIADLVLRYLPWGSGLGTFVEVWAIAEPETRLGPKYLNHAHNDLLEAALTGGLPLLAIIAAALLYCFGRTASVHQGVSNERALRRAGASILIILGLGSLYDYPLRVPSVAVVAALAFVWFAGRTAATGPGSGIGKPGPN